MLATQCLASVAAQGHARSARRRARAGRERPRTWRWRSSASSRAPAASGYTIEFAGDAVRALSMEERMTLCNMSIEAGARSSLVARRRHYLRLSRGPPARAARRRLDRGRGALARLRIGPGRHFDREVDIDASAVAPLVTWGTRPDMVAPVTARVPGSGGADLAHRAGKLRTGAGLHGARRRHRHRRHSRRPRLHRLVHQRAHRGPARSGARGPRPPRVAVGARAGRARIAARQARRRSRGPARGPAGGGVRMARARLLDVPRHERRRARSPASAAPRPATATSKAGRAAAAAPTWSARRWPPRPRSAATSPTSAAGSYR